MATSLRPNQLQPSHSPTSSASSQNTTPTSPHFANLARSLSTSTSSRPAYPHPYAHAPPRHQASTSSFSTTTSTPPSSHSTLNTISHPRPATPPLFHPPVGQPSLSAYLRSWGSAEIAQFLAIYKCQHHAAAFARNDIDGKVLLDVDMAGLKEMGVAKVGERVKILGGIKDLRKRVAGVGNRVELRLNGAATPPLSIDDSPVMASSMADGARRLVTPAERLGGQSGQQRRMHSARPPPLELQPHTSSRPLPEAYQTGPTSAGRSTTPRPSVPAPISRSNTSQLRAPPAREGGRRSPSPVNPNEFSDRPLPPAPNQSSAAEYASSYTRTQREHHQGATPTWAQQPTDTYGLPRGPAPSKAGQVRAQETGTHHKSPSVGGGGTASKTSPIKAKFSGMLGGSKAPQGAVHPFAAPRRDDDKRSSPPHAQGLGPPISSDLKRHPSPTPPSIPPPQTARLNPKAESSHSSYPRALPLDDIRRRHVKFINHDDRSSRTVNVANASSGVEVLERALKKFGKWNPAGMGGRSGTDTESDEDGEKLEVDGWGVYADSDPGDDAKPLSEASLLGICMSNQDGSSIRDRGLVLKRTKQRVNRKNMEDLLGETPPPLNSPTSPTYHGGPRLGIQAADPSILLTPSKSGLSKKTNRASTVSVMSGLGVPLTNLPTGSADTLPPSPTTARSHTSSGGLLSKGKKMYNFFGHRPPSELITNHLQEYFPTAKPSTLERSWRNSIMAGGAIKAAKRGSIAPSEHSSRKSAEVELKRKNGGEPVKASPPRKGRPASRVTIMSSPPPAGTIVEEEKEELGEGVPRMSVSGDDGSISRPTIDGESSRPPLLPPFEPSKESLSETLSHYSPTGRARPKSTVYDRRGSAGSTKSRMSMLSQLRRNRDRSDTASLLTVDEITQEVENRRASTITFEDSDEDDEVVPAKAVVDTGLPEDEVEEEVLTESSDEDTESEESSVEESDEEEEEVDEDEEGEDEHGKAFTSAGSKRSIKWIKGALIGAGSFGSVFLGMDAQSGLLMAVKQVELPTGSAKNEERKRSMVEALEREIELLKELQHENIVQYLDSSTDGHHLNIFLEYVPGGSVAALLNNYGAFEEALVKNFVRQILTGLNYLHERGIIHRDIKGANILVDNKGGIKISDFGISKKVESNLMTGLKTNRPSLQGSVFWMAPEIVKQTSYTLKADIWSVGCLVVEMLTGTHPWADLSQMQAIFRIGSSARPATPSDISPEAADFLRRTFEIDHTARPTATELLEHPFIASRSGGGGGMISAAQAKASMAAAHASAQRGMTGMQSLSALAEAR